MAVKQRVIWLNDEEWAALGALAVRAGLTRSRLVAGSIEGALAPNVPPPDILSLAHTVWRENEPGVTFGTFRPAPKPGKR